MFNFFKINNRNLNSGFTIIEIFAVIAIMGIISTIILFNLSGFRNEQDLKNTTTDIVTLLNKARQDTLSSINSTNYSVHFETNKAVLFSGVVYSALDKNNEVVNFSSTVSIPTSGGINLGGENNVIFERLTGEATSGSVIIRLNSDVSKQKTITISNTGIVSLD